MGAADALRARLSRLGFGCASFWAKPMFPAARAIALVHEAIERGVSVFDTGPMYAAGEAECRLGKAIHGIDLGKLVIMSKAGEPSAASGGHKDFSAAAIRHSLHGSLRRLGVERLDVLSLHGCPRRDWSDELRGELDRMRRDGEVLAVGLNSFDAADLDAAIGDPLFDALMFDVNVLNPGNAERALRAAAAGKLVFSAASLARAAYRRHWWHIRSAADGWYWLRAMRERPVAAWPAELVPTAGPADSPAQRALRWTLAQGGVDCALFNTTRLQHLRANLACLD